jgi:ArsR family transcriptional regulator, virulence genes transcriptional regulator
MKASVETTPLPVRIAPDLDKLEKSARQAAILLKSMANTHRLKILCQLAEGEKAVGELEGVIGLSQSALSQHLMVLRRDGIVSARRVAQSVFYSLVSKEAQAIVLVLYDLFCRNAAGAGSTRRRPNGR